MSVFFSLFPSLLEKKVLLLNICLCILCVLCASMIPDICTRLGTATPCNTQQHTATRSNTLQKYMHQFCIRKYRINSALEIFVFENIWRLSYLQARVHASVSLCVCARAHARTSIGVCVCVSVSVFVCVCLCVSV